MKDQTCCFIGPRYIPVSEYSALDQRLEDEMETLIHQGVRYFRAGGAQGFDTMAAFAVLRLRLLYPHIRLILDLFCKNQTRGWDRPNKKIYNLILRQADEVVCVSKKYIQDCIEKRDEHLVNSSSICICYLANQKSVTAYKVNCAKRQGLRVINIAAADRGDKEGTS